MAYVAPLDIEKVYEEMLLYYREVERLADYKKLPTPTPRSRSSSASKPIPSTPRKEQASPRAIEQAESAQHTPNYANHVRGRKGTLPKLKRTLSGSLASIVEMFEK